MPSAREFFFTVNPWSVVMAIIIVWFVVTVLWSFHSGGKEK